MPNRFKWLVFLLTAACTRAISTSEPTPSSEAIPETRRPPLIAGPKKTWVFTPAPEPRRYLSTSSTTVQLTSEPGASRGTLAQSTQFSITITGDSISTALNGSLEDFSTDVGNRITGPVQLIPLPFPFTGQTLNKTIVLKPVQLTAQNPVTDCNNPALSLLTTVQRNIFVPPKELTTSMTWLDSASINTCSGPIPVTLTTTRTYTVMGEVEDQRLRLILVNRTEKTTSSGEGSQGQHRILLRSEGGGSARLYLDQQSGLLVRAEAEYQTALTVSSSGRVQRFSQTVRERISSVQ